MSQNDDIYDINIKHGRSLVDTEQTLGRDYNRALLTFSGGALAVSVTLVSGGFGTSLLESYFNLLYFSWLLFGVSIIGTIFSIKASQISFQVELNDLYSDITKESTRYEGAWVSVSKWLTVISFTLFTVAITLLLFIFLNINIAKGELNGVENGIEESSEEGIEESMEEGEHPEASQKGTSSSSKTSRETRQAQRE